VECLITIHTRALIADFNKNKGTPPSTGDIEIDYLGPHEMKVHDVLKLTLCYTGYAGFTTVASSYGKFETTSHSFIDDLHSR